MKTAFRLAGPLFLSITLHLFAQNPEWMVYTNGALVRAMAESGPFVWAGTQGGLVRIEKNTGIRTFYHKGNSGLVDHDIQCLAADRNGNLWIGSTTGGLLKYDGITWVPHLAGRCVGCDECTRICPAGIDLRLLNLRLARAAEDGFGYRAGVDREVEPIIGSYSLKDKECFIR